MLGAVKSSIGGIDDLLRQLAVVGKCGDTYRDAHLTKSLSAVRYLQVSHAFAQGLGALVSGVDTGVGQDQQKFFAPVAAGNIAAADVPAEQRRSFAQQDVARLM